jgi:dUTP pyrophosphatase
MRDFEKISFKQFKKDVKDDKELYESYKLPSRGSTAAAGYDLFLVENLTIAPNEIVKIPTGVKMRCEKDEVLLIIVKSSTGFKYNIRLVNQVGVIDADYYNNPGNEGHIMVALVNMGKDEFVIHKGERVAQGIFLGYLTTDNDQAGAGAERQGGFGSTGKGE